MTTTAVATATTTTPAACTTLSAAVEVRVTGATTTANITHSLLLLVLILMLTLSQWGGPELGERAHWYDSYNDSRFFELLKASLDPARWKLKKALLRAEAERAEVNHNSLCPTIYVPSLL
jgi:hypothetical protein